VNKHFRNGYIMLEDVMNINLL